MLCGFACSNIQTYRLWQNLEHPAAWAGTLYTCAGADGFFANNMAQ